METGLLKTKNEKETENFGMEPGAEMTRFNEEEISLILDLLAGEYPDAGCALRHMDVFELAVSVV